MATLATVENMQRFEAAHPGRDLPGGGHVEGKRCVAYSPLTGETCSGTAGDYFWLGAGDPLRDSAGEPMILVTSAVHYADALSGEVV